MTGALIILLFLVVVGVVLYLFDRRHRGAEEPEPEESRDAKSPAESGGDADDSECCGLHAVCEKMYKSTDKPVYYDDEELDRFRGRGAEDYSEEETEEFRDVMITLLPRDRYGWAQSMQERGIELPPVIKDELLMLISEES